MSVTKGKKTNRWMSQVRVKDSDGRITHRKKRGFATKREALQYERQVLDRNRPTPAMRFKDFADIYMEDMARRLKPSSMETKRIQLETKILSDFRDMPLSAIGKGDVLG